MNYNAIQSCKREKKSLKKPRYFSANTHMYLETPTNKSSTMVESSCTNASCLLTFLFPSSFLS